MKQTPLYGKHLQAGAKMIDFGGWMMPVQYTGIREEHERVRSSAGLFDVSHMGEIMVQGPEALKFIQKMVTNDLSAMKDGQVMYSPMCYPDGGVVDDLLVYKYSGEKYLLVVNASNTEKDYSWLKENLHEEAVLQDCSKDFAQLALQGPAAESVLQKLTDFPLSQIKFFYFNREVKLCGREALVSRTGYTGEDGFEIYVAAEEVELLWDRILDAGKEEGVVPVGLGARDTLRFEAALSLYGHEISPEITPLEAGLGRFVKLDKEDFIGKAALVRQKEEGLKRKLVGFEMIDRGVPRSHYDVMVQGEPAGFVTSGSFSPTFKKNMGLALLKQEYTYEGVEISVVIRGEALKARVVKTPFYKRSRDTSY